MVIDNGQQNLTIENQPLLAVIVPCYNLEKYVNKCVSSIVKQTYTCLEILLIDDGSTDKTGIICDAWQKKDQRIHVIHKRNEGPSYARKTGIENTAAEYITFVDADDWIDINMYADMMSVMISTGSDIAQCEYLEIFDDKNVNCNGGKYETMFDIIGREEGVLLILKDKQWRSYVWNKIFKRKLFDHVIFPTDRVYEDIPIVHTLFHHASQSVFLYRKYYFYYRREGSIVNSNNIAKKMKAQYHYAWAYYDRYIFTTQYSQYNSELQRLKNKALLEGVVCLRNMITFPQYFSDNDFELQAKRLKTISVSRKDALPFLFKLDLFILRMGSNNYKKYRSLYDRFIRKPGKSQ